MFHLPIEESAPSDGKLLLIASLPFALFSVGLHSWPLWLTFGLTVGASAVVRYSPWFKRPESYMLNALVGWLFGAILSLLLWH